jgi:crossover junction endodeoxyribonuclease RuvC
MGYGLVDDTGGEPAVVALGVLTAGARQPLGERLHTLYQELLTLLARYSPSEVVVEEPFVGMNPKTALAVGQAQGVALMAAASLGVPVARYAPAAVKQAVTGHGHASKEQVQQALAMLLKTDTASAPEDATDALAVALCHLQARRAAALPVVKQ